MVKDIEDIALKRSDRVPDHQRASYLYETDPINNRIAPRPLVGGVGRRGKLYELSEEVEIVIGTGGVGYCIFNPDVEVYSTTDVSNPSPVAHGPTSAVPICTTTSAAYTQTVVNNSSGLGTGEVTHYWSGSKYAANLQAGALQWQCCGYGLRVVRETAALSQDGSIILYRSYNNTAVSGFGRTQLTANKNYRLIQGADLAPNGKEIILAGVPVKAQQLSWPGSDEAWTVDSMAWQTTRVYSSTPTKGGLLVFCTGTPGHRYRVELVAGFMLYGTSISPKTRFPASASSVDFLANIRLDNVKPGRDERPNETRKAVDTLMNHHHQRESGVMEFVTKTAPHAIRKVMDMAEKIGHILPISV